MDAQGTSRRRLAGIALMVLATGVFTLMHAITKTLAPRYPALELAALRGMASLPFVLAWLCAVGAWRNVRRVRWPLQLLRGVSQLVTIVGVTFALKALPIADAYAISYAAPLLVAVFSVVLLRERADRARWLAVLAGFVGVLIVLQPSGTPMLTLAGLAMLASAAGYATSVLIVRVLVRTDSTVNLVFWMTVLLSVSAGLLALPDWQAISRSDAPLLAGIGFLGVAGQYAITRALTLAPASLIAPFEYTSLIWALGLDGWLWNTQPSLRMLAGTGVIILSGLYLAANERKRGRRAVSFAKRT